MGKYLFIFLTWCAVYFFGFGFIYELLDLISDRPHEINELIASGGGILFASIITLTGTFKFTDTEEEKYDPYILDDGFVSGDNLSVVFNMDTFTKWMRIHYKNELNGTGEWYVTHYRMEQLLNEYYEEFDFIKSGPSFALKEERLHNQFIFDIKTNWLNSTQRTV